MEGPRINAIISLAKSILFEYVCGEVQRSLAQAGISMLVLKGPHVKSSFYEKTSEREYCDLDILVRPQDFQRALRILLGNGSQRFASNPRRLASQHADYQVLLQSHRGVGVELHRALADESQFRSDVDGFFRRSERFRFGELEVRGLGTEDLLLHLCLHLGKRHFMTCERKHLQDISLLLKKRTVDWDAFLARVRYARCRVISYLSLTAVKEQHLAEIPLSLLKELEPGLLRRRILGRFIDPSAFPLYRFSRSFSGMRDRFANLLLLDSLPIMFRSMVSFSEKTLGDLLLRWRPLRRFWLARRPL